MGWIKRKVDEHVCSKPRWNKDVREGDVWECDLCHAQYRVKKVKTWDDQRDPGPYGSIDEWDVISPARIVLPRTSRDHNPGVTSWRDQ